MKSLRLSLLAGVVMSAVLAEPWLRGEPPDAPPPETLFQTFSIAAMEPETGVCGVAVASKAPQACKSVGHARAGPASKA